jgi:two-component system response regulator NreC
MNPTTSPSVNARPAVIRVVVADDNQIVRTGLRMLLGIARDIEVVGEAADGIDALGIIARLAPQVAVLDIDMPRMNGLAATKALVAGDSATRTLILTMHMAEEYRASILDAGAAGYLTKSVADSELPGAIRAVAAGRMYTQREPMRAFERAAQAMALPEQRKQYERLNDRERVVFMLIAGGWSASEIGAKLFLSSKTVDAYRERIGRKLGFTHRADYLRLCLRLGLLRAH